MNRLLVTTALLGLCITAAHARSSIPLGITNGGSLAASPSVGQVGIPLGSTELSIPGLSLGSSNGSLPGMVPQGGRAPTEAPMGSMGSSLSGSVAAPNLGVPASGVATSALGNQLITNYGPGGMASLPGSSPPTRRY